MQLSHRQQMGTTRMSGQNAGPLVDIDHVDVLFGHQQILRDICLQIQRGQTLSDYRRERQWENGTDEDDHRIEQAYTGARFCLPAKTSRGSANENWPGFEFDSASYFNWQRCSTA